MKYKLVISPSEIRDYDFKEDGVYILIVYSIYNAEEINQILLDLKIPVIAKDYGKNKILI